jgi:NitT/TauT family transport system substrate-binding protein
MQLTAGIVRRARGLKLVNICQVAQHSALMLVAKKSSGIIEPQDINGKKVGLWGEDFQGQLQAFFRKYGLKVQTVPQGTTLNLFLRGGVEVASAMRYNEYHLLLNAGLNPEELTTFPLADHGFNFPEDGIYCLERTYKEKPQGCSQFVQGSIAGWQYAFAHPEEALDIVMKYVDAAHVPTDRVHQKWMLERMRDLILPGGGEIPLGTLAGEDYFRVAETLKNEGIIKEIPDFSQFIVDGAGAHEK